MKIYNIRIVLGVFTFATVAAYADQKSQSSTSETVAKARRTQPQNFASEGGVVSLPVIHNVREGYTESPSKVPLNATTSKTDKAPSISKSPKSTVTDTVHRITAKKGVGNENVSRPSTEPPRITANEGVGNENVSRPSTEPPAKPKKPTITVPGSNESVIASNSPPDKLNSTMKMPKVPNSNILSSSNVDNTQKYIVPIVIVILSVPFVAILISVVYKRGAEWWKYRHYRRMDFLINGIYDN